MDWTETYRPSTLTEVRGNDKARDAFREWAQTWDDHGEAVILHGSPGVGKTSAAHALANDMGWATIELNASDQRTADAIEKYAGGAAMNHSLTGTGRQLIILDEADNLHHNKDRGGAGAITRLVKESNQPIVLIANEFYDMSRGLRNACRDIQFRDVSARSILPVLRDVCRKEGVAFDEGVLKGIAQKNDGDLRGAIKDLQAREQDGEILERDDQGDRDRSKGIFELLDAVLKEATAQEALQTAYATDETPDDLLLWVEDKAPVVYEPDELADAYEFLANADRWLGRVMATQNYSYWRYATDNVAAGVAAARTQTRGGWTRYGGAPYRSSKDSTRDYVARQVAEAEGVSMATARRAIVPYLAAMTHHCTNRELTVAMTARYDLDPEHVAFVTGSGKDTNKVQDIVEEAVELREQDAVEHAGDAFLDAHGSQPDAEDAEEDAAGDAEEDAEGDADADEGEGDGSATAGDGSGTEQAAAATLGTDDAADAGDGADAGDPENGGEDEDDEQQSGLNDFF